MNKEDIVSILHQIRPNHTFLSIYNYENNYKEISHFSLSFHASYINVLNKSLDCLRTITFKDPIYRIAKDEVMESLKTSVYDMEHHNYHNCTKHYDYFFGQDKRIVKGVKLHRNSECLHMTGYLLRKEIITPGTYPERKLSPKCFAKNRIRDMLRIGKYRQFKIALDRFDYARIENHTILPPED